MLSELPVRYRLILCDLWGCVHNGHSLLPGALDRLTEWRKQGRTVLFVTNAPRSAAAVEQHLEQLGLPRDLYADVVSAGQVGVAALRGRAVGFCGTHADRVDLEAQGLSFIGDGFKELACAGLSAGETVPDYADRLSAWRSDDVLLHCFNPDRIVIHGTERMICAGALADAYEAIGGRVCWYGKPYRATYEYALRTGGSPAKDEVLAIGDGLETDVRGAAEFGIDCVFVEGGIHAGEPLPLLQGSRKPIAVVPSLA